MTVDLADSSWQQVETDVVRELSRSSQADPQFVKKLGVRPYCAVRLQEESVLLENNDFELESR